jgi:superfamily II DNA or RNA helicase
LVPNRRPAKAKVTDRLYRNSTSFPAKMTAMLRNLYREYKAAQENPAAREHAWAALLKYYQFVVRRVMTDPEYGIGSEGNARGLLLAHGMGMGKTIAAAAIAMALWDVRQPVVVLARSLQQNFLDTVAKVIAMTQRDLPAEELAARQAAAQARFSFVTLDAYNMADQLGRAGTREKGRRGGPAVGLTVGALDGKLLIVDEAHNLFRAIINSGSETTNARRFYSMVQEARDLRIVFLTGTPASKDPFELVPCFNMLAGSDLLPPQYEIFTKLYVDREGRRVKNRDKLANRLVGLVSFVTHSLPTEPTPGSLRTRLEDIPVELAAEEAGVEPPESIVAAGPRRERDVGWFPERKPLVVDRVEMGAEQYRWYLLAREKEEAEGKGGQGGPRKEGVLAAPALALPGAEKKAMRSYFVRSRTIGNYAPPRETRGRPIEEIPPDGFAPERGPKLARVAERAAAAPGPILAYSQFVEHGLKALAGFLRRAGFVEWDPSAHTSAPAYALISGEVDLARRAEIKDAFNAADNLHGERLKALLVSKTGAEGLDLKNIREVHVLEPYWDKAREDQVVFRAVRLGSHDMLPREEREVASYLYIAAPNAEILANIPPANREAKTIDELFHDRALTKYEINRDFRKLLSEVSLECSLLGYGACRMCVPTDAVLFHDDPALDLRIPNPCEPMRSQEVDVREIRVAVAPGAEPRTYYFADDPSSPLGVRFYEFREDLDGYAEIDLAEGVVDALLRAVRARG